MTELGRPEGRWGVLALLPVPLRPEAVPPSRSPGGVENLRLPFSEECSEEVAKEWTLKPWTSGEFGREVIVLVRVCTVYNSSKFLFDLGKFFWGVISTSFTSGYVVLLFVKYQGFSKVLYPLHTFIMALSVVFMMTRTFQAQAEVHIAPLTSLTHILLLLLLLPFLLFIFLIFLPLLLILLVFIFIIFFLSVFRDHTTFHKIRRTSPLESAWLEFVVLKEALMENEMPPAGMAEAAFALDLDYCPQDVLCEEEVVKHSHPPTLVQRPPEELMGFQVHSPGYKKQLLHPGKSNMSYLSSLSYLIELLDFVLLLHPQGISPFQQVLCSVPCLSLQIKPETGRSYHSQGQENRSGPHETVAKAHLSSLNVFPTELATEHNAQDIAVSEAVSIFTTALKDAEDTSSIENRCNSHFAGTFFQAKLETMNLAVAPKQPKDSINDLVQDDLKRFRSYLAEDERIGVSKLENADSTDDPCKTPLLHDLLTNAIEKAMQSLRGHLDLFLRFLMGISLESNQILLRGVLNFTEDTKDSIAKISKHINEMLKTRNLPPETSVNLIYCLLELRDSSIFTEVQGYLKREHKTKLSQSMCSVLAYTLLMSKEVVDELDIKSHSSTFGGYLNLLPAVRCCKKAILWDCKVQDQGCHYLASALRSNPLFLQELHMGSIPNLSEAPFFTEELLSLLIVGRVEGSLLPPTASELRNVQRCLLQRKLLLPLGGTVTKTLHLFLLLLNPMLQLDKFLMEKLSC
ncbi:hypothetical protein DNTS_011408 [Danionella cerebrum]|uniref:NACHT LRR and PYD domain-containing protein n=1 Tax=Danionella cerebrum TaxID=2873325 RepID=A0A553PVX2_9TELE|nr:hypothetical protein DNTS_011408 [Danionella translucida]